MRDEALAPVPMTLLYTFPWKPNDGTNATQYRVQFNFEPAYVNENIAFAQIDPVPEFMFSEIEGLEDLVLTQDGQTNTGVTVVVSTSCGGVNLYDEYASELADPDAWVATNEATGAALVIDTVTAVGASKGFGIVLDTPPATGVKYSVSLATPAPLAALNIVGYESNKLIVTQIA